MGQHSSIYGNPHNNPEGSQLLVFWFSRRRVRTSTMCRLTSTKGFVRVSRFDGCISSRTVRGKRGPVCDSPLPVISQYQAGQSLSFKRCPRVSRLIPESGSITPRFYPTCTDSMSWIRWKHPRSHTNTLWASERRRLGAGGHKRSTPSALGSGSQVNVHHRLPDWLSLQASGVEFRNGDASVLGLVFFVSDS